MTPVFRIDDLSVGFRKRQTTILAVREVSLEVQARECIGIVGESGSGKTQIFMAARIACAARSRMIFQDPMTSLTPHLKIGVQLAEVLVCHAGKSWGEARAAARRIVERVLVPDAARRLTKYPQEHSVGLRQRVMIGMRLMCEPTLVVADEPTTALDVTVQAQIIDLLRSLRAEAGMALVLISHDLAVVAGLADRILVMYAGRVVESSAAGALFGHALHPYTAELLKCIPSLSGPRLARLPTLSGQPPRPGEVFVGCAFAPRCPRAAQRCRTERPLLQDVSAARRVACHFPLSA